MLKENQLKAIEMYFEGTHTMQEIADACEYKNRRSVYDLLERPEVKEYIERLAQESLDEALNSFRIASKKLSKKIISIANGEIGNTKTVYAQLQALNSVLEKAGLTAKNTFVIENKKGNDEDHNDLMEMLEQDKAQGE
jgi:predicted DNA-binding protein YlxM (UPF0122 family)